MTVPTTPGMTLTSLLSRIADYTEDVILVTEAEPIDLPGPRIVYVNSAFTAMTGYAPADVIDQTPRLLQGPKTSEAARAKIRAALKAWKPVRVELLNYRKDGSEFWVELNITPVADEAGWFRYWVSVQREVGERRHFDEQRRLYELIIDHIDEGIVVGNARRQDCAIEFVSSGFTRMSGFSKADLLGRNCHALLPIDVESEARRLIGRAIEGQEATSVQALYHRKDGTELWARTSISILRDDVEQTTKLVAVFRDLTDVMRQERELVAAQRLAAVGEMTGGIAHDFNNLLTSISGSAELLARLADSDAELSRLAASILGASQRGAIQVRRLLGFSRTPLLARGPVDLRALLREVGQLLGRTLRDDIALEIDLDPAARWVDAEAVQLEGAVLNLALNARDAIDGSGYIKIRGRAVDSDGPPMVRLEVIDNGSGMDESTQARAFDAFFTTKEPGRGSGLGLAMVKAFVTQLGGSVDVSSAVGEGSTFAILLPAAPHESTGFGDLDAATTAAAVPCKVLVVEDDDVVRITARAMLEAQGHQVHECGNADDALVLLATVTSFDVLFTDVMMPGSMGGVDLAFNAKKLRPSIRVILTSGWADLEIPPHARMDLQAQFVLKPYSLDDLSQAFAKALDSALP